MMDSQRRELLIKEFKVNRFAAHQYLFPHRHKDSFAEFHRELVDLYNNAGSLFAAGMVFRGGAKSTFLEEDVLISALLQEEEYILYVGPKWESACEHLEPIRNELEMNEAIFEIFGDQKSSPWSSDELQLANGVRIKAIGAGQSMRGTKNNSERPTMAAIDDLEDEENIKTEESRRKTERWLTGTLIPALHPTRGRIKFVGTPLHPKALINKKCQDKEWASKIFPIMYQDPVTGEERSAWESRFPVAWIKKRRQEYLNSGNFVEFEQEYMCRAEDVAGKPFQPGMIKTAPAPGNFLPHFMAVDPARTVNEKRSARTGYVDASWIGNQLVVHDAQGHFHKPDEIINTIFEWNQKYQPVFIGVETNSLEEFIMQPLRTKVLETGISLPLVPLRAPKDKIDFIKGLQFFYAGGSVTHAKPLPDLENELLQFPTGRMDVPNALAYLLRMRSGRAVYQDFTYEHIAPVLEINSAAPRWLVVSARPSMTCAALVQYHNQVLRVYANWVWDKPPQEALPLIYREAILQGAGTLKFGAPPEQFDRYTNHGLPAAAARYNLQFTRLAPLAKTEGVLKSWLTRRVEGNPAVLVSMDARWTVNGFAGGYARKLEKDGTLAPYPEDNQYRVLLEAIESFVFWFDSQKVSDNMDNVRYASTPDGRRYLTSLPGRI